VVRIVAGKLLPEWGMDHVLIRRFCALVASYGLALIATRHDCAQAVYAPRLSARTAVAAQQSRAVEAIEIMHCLKAADLDWLADSPVLQRAKSFQVGLRHDRKTYPGEDVVFVVVFENPTQGDVFELTREDHGRDRTYRIENNGEFKLGRKGIEWPGEILGGNWTHDYIEANIRKLMHGPKIRVQLKTVLKPIQHVSCNSYMSKH
jgi:hypothetical protein